MTTPSTEYGRLQWAACDDKPRWYLFCASSSACFLGGILFILGYRLLRRTAVWIRGKLKKPDVTRRPSAVAVSEESDESFKDQTTCHKCKYYCSSVLGALHGLALYLVSYQTVLGRTFITLSMLLSFWSFGIYVYEATVWPNEVEKCGPKGSYIRFMDLSINLFFLFHFIFRLIAARDALMFWVDGFSIIDYLTIPPILLGFALKRTWLGFRFVRVFRLTNLPEILHNLNIIKSGTSLQLCHFITIFLSIYFSGAGMFLLLENSGNLFTLHLYNISDPINYPTALYFTMVTMSTVGYGDIAPKTLLGRIFIIIFILVALATFAGAIPVIEERFFRTRRYHGTYSKPEEVSHIVVCGDINTSSVKTFLASFLHEDRQRSDVEVVFINPTVPDLQLQSILRLHFSRVKYFQGTVMDQNDLRRVRIEEADACLVLASSTANDPDAKDAGNIMRVIAVKNYAPHVRVIVQLLQTENKAHLFNSPYWSWESGDEILCFSELKLGFLAQSCIAPGFSTLLINLFSMQSERDAMAAEKLHNAIVIRKPRGSRVQLRHSALLGRSSMRSSNLTSSRTVSQPQTKFSTFIGNMSERAKFRRYFSSELGRAMNSSMIRASTLVEKQERKVVSRRVEDKDWYHNYLLGMNMEIYSAQFSPSFEGLCFSKAAVICRQNLDLLLIAIFADLPRGNKEAYKGTDDSDSSELEEDTEESGYQFLTINPTDASGIVIRKNTIGFFMCDSQANANRASIYCARCHGDDHFRSPHKIKPCGCGMKYTSNYARLQQWWNRANLTSSAVDDPIETVESGEPDSEGVVLRSGEKYYPETDPKQSSSKEVRIDSKAELDVTGMYHYCPARSFDQGHLLHATSASWRSKNLYGHILVCLVTEADSPMLGLQSFVMPLRASNITTNHLKTIVFVGNESYLRREWQNLENFPNVYYLPGSPLHRYHLRAARIRCCSVCVVLGSAVQSRTDDPFLIDKEVILCSLTIRAMKFQRFPADSKIPKLFHRRYGYQIPLIAELKNDSNINYLDPDDPQSLEHHISPPLTGAYARGVSFTSSVLDVLASTAYFDSHAISVIRHLVCSGITPAMEQWFAEGSRLNPYEAYVPDDTTSENEMRAKTINRSIRQMHMQLGTLELRQRPRLEQLSVLDSRLRSKPNAGFLIYGDLFCHAIQMKGILCLGLYRMRYIDKSEFDMTICDDDSPQPTESETVEDKDAAHPMLTLTVPKPVTVRRDPIEVEPTSAIVVNRYVITNPPNHFRLRRSDLVFCLCPFYQSDETT